MRNWLQHKEKVNSEFAITPNEAVIRFIDDLIHRVESRSKCKDIYVPFKDVYAQTMQGSVRDSILEMRRHLYTHIPIIENETVVGVFDENSIFNYLAEEEIIAIDEALTFADIIKYIQLEDREMETFEFVNENTYVDILEQHFEKAFQNGKRLGMVFINSDGKKESPLHGIITPWDILGINLE